MNFLRISPPFSDYPKVPLDRKWIIEFCKKNNLTPIESQPIVDYYGDPDALEELKLYLGDLYPSFQAEENRSTSEAHREIVSQFIPLDFVAAFNNLPVADLLTKESLETALEGIKVPEVSIQKALRALWSVPVSTESHFNPVLDVDKLKELSKKR